LSNFLLTHVQKLLKSDDPSLLELQLKRSGMVFFKRTVMAYVGLYVSMYIFLPFPANLCWDLYCIFTLHVS